MKYWTISIHSKHISSRQLDPDNCIYFITYHHLRHFASHQRAGWEQDGCKYHWIMREIDRSRVQPITYTLTISPSTWSVYQIKLKTYFFSPTSSQIRIYLQETILARIRLGLELSNFQYIDYGHYIFECHLP